MQTVLNLLEAEPIRLLLSFGVILFLVLNLAGILTFAERKVAAYIQLRYGPNRVGPRGCCSPRPTSSSCSPKRTSCPTGPTSGSSSGPR
jgi:NADH-quinone oxidoreductase subunit H